MLSPEPEGSLLKRADFLDVDEDARQGRGANRTYYFRKTTSDPLKVIEDCSLKLRLDPFNSQLLLMRGNALVKNREYQAAVADFSIVIDREPTFLEALSARGFTLSKLGAYEEAVVDLTEVLRLDPKNAAAGFARAACYNAIGK